MGDGILHSGDYGPGRDLGIEPALHVARTIHFDLVEANAAAWQWWTAVSKVDYKDGLIYTDFNESGDEQNILTSKMLWVLGNYSRFIRPGAKRIDLTGLGEEADSGLLGSAYVHEGEQTVTAVFVNHGDQDKCVQVHHQELGLTRQITTMESYVTNAERDLVCQERITAAEEEQSFIVNIPGKSVVTLTGGTEKEERKE